MALEINDQYDFFRQVQLDDDGNLLVSIVNGLSGDYLPLSGGTVTGDTIFTAGLTANSLSSSSILWEDIDTTGVVISPKASSVSALGNTNSLAHGQSVNMSNNINSAIIAVNSGDIRRSNESFIAGSNSAQIFNTELSLIIASNSSVIGEDIGTSTGQRNAIIASETSSIINAGSTPYYGIYNSAIIGSENSDIRATNTIGETTERVILLGMKDYTIDNLPGVHVENLYITSGATADYVWTAVDSSGRGEWRVSAGSNLNIDGGTAFSITLDLNIDGGGA